MIIAGAIVAAVVREHAEESAFLHALRTSLKRAPHVGLGQLAGFDERLAAHLDGLSVAGEHGWPFCDAALEVPSASSVFTAAVRAIADRQERRVDRCLALAEAVPESRVGLTSAFGWLAREQLQGIVAGLLGSEDPFRRLIGIAACALHRVDPSLVSARRIRDANSIVRARALRTAGEVGCQEAIPECAARMQDDDPECQFWAARSSVLLGNRGTALAALTSTGLSAGPHRLRGFPLALQAMSGAEAHGVLRQLAANPAQLRWLIQGSGIGGDPAYVPWLIGHMANEQTARLAAEAFVLITGVDLDLRLEGPPPENIESGPTDDPEDPNVDMDPDDGLPWPDPKKVESWWATNGSRFQAGTRYFMGAPVTRKHCIEVLKNGYQRQRILAAHYMCLLDPGTPLFNTSAPAWRQQRMLAEMK